MNDASPVTYKRFPTNTSVVSKFVSCNPRFPSNADRGIVAVPKSPTVNVPVTFKSFSTPTFCVKDTSPFANNLLEIVASCNTYNLLLKEASPVTNIRLLVIISVEKLVSFEPTPPIIAEAGIVLSAYPPAVIVPVTVNALLAVTFSAKVLSSLANIFPFIVASPSIVTLFIDVSPATNKRFVVLVSLVNWVFVNPTPPSIALWGIEPAE